MTNESELLRAKLIGIMGRIISVEEMREALGLKQSTYYDQLREGRLISLQNLKTLSDKLDINEVWLLAECGLIDRRSIKEYTEMMSGMRTLEMRSE